MKKNVVTDIKTESLGITSIDTSFMLKIFNVQLLVTNNFPPTI